MKKYYLVTIIFALLLSPLFASALNLTYPEFGGFSINDPSNQNLPTVLGWLYSLLVGISGLAAFLMLVWGGFKWLTSAGNPTRIADAKDTLTKALLGLLLVLSSFIIVQFINPELTGGLLKSLDPIKSASLQPVQSVATDFIADTSIPPLVGFAVESIDGVACANCQSANIQTGPPFPPGNTVKLTWDITNNPINCQKLSEPPIATWDSPAGNAVYDFKGEQDWQFFVEDDYAFTIRCFYSSKILDTSVFIYATESEPIDCSSGGEGCEEPILGFKVKDLLEPATEYISEDREFPTDFPSGSAEFTWTSNANTCVGSDLLAGNSGTFGFAVIDAFLPGENHYTIICSSPGGTTKGTIKINST